MLEIERVQDTLWALGSVMPTEEKNLEEALRKFMQEVKSPTRVVDLSNVRYISTSAAKALLSLAQDLKGGTKLSVRVSLPVQRTLNQMNGEQWLEMEMYQKPSPRPNAPPAAATDETAPAGDHAEVRHSSVGLNAPGTSAFRTSSSSVSSELAMAEALGRANQPLVAPDAPLPDELAPLRRLLIMQTYTFHVGGTRSEITARVLSHLGGPWIMVDAHGARKYIKILQVGVIDLLA
jgi:anti-anti-sigma regulatory factor